MNTSRLRPPFPYFGAKVAIADRIWEALGNPGNFVDPFCGSCAVLYARPTRGKVETVNDAWGFIPNALRALRADPQGVADVARWPVDETMMHARHRWLVDRADETFIERLMTEPQFYDLEVAAWWIWGQSIWIGAGWCATAALPARAVERPRQSRKRTPAPMPGAGRNRSARQPGGGRCWGQIPSLAGSDGSGVGHGRGIFAGFRQEDLLGYFAALSARLQRVRIICGDWQRVVTPAVTVSHGLTGILLDPPYGAAA